MADLQCKRCSGTGEVHCERMYHGERSDFWDEQCPDCQGTGKAKPAPTMPDTLTPAYFKGQRAYRRGLVKSDCPFAGGQQMHDWLRGYRDASGGTV